LEQSVQELGQILALVVGRNDDQRPHEPPGAQVFCHQFETSYWRRSPFFCELTCVVWLGPDTIPGHSREGGPPSRSALRRDNLRMHSLAEVGLPSEARSRRSAGPPPRLRRYGGH